MTQSDQPIPQELLDAKDGLVDAASRPLLVSEALPDTLYHFTDVGGLVGMLQSKALWLSLAHALNDRSEIQYGIELAQRRLEAAELGSRAFRNRIQHFLEPGNTLPGMEDVVFHPFLLSFCERDDLSGHWLNYGRSGTGVALGFRSAGLSVPGVAEVRRVRYDTNEQSSLVDEIVRSVWNYHEQLPQVVRSTITFELAAHTTAVHLRLAAAVFKSSFFENEHEWRLITRHSPKLPDVEIHGGKNLPVRFRPKGSRILPFVEVPYTRLPVAEVVLGDAAPTPRDDISLRLLLEQCGEPDAPVRRSPVAVRP